MSQLMVVKRNGNVVEFEIERIKNAILKAIRATNLTVSESQIDSLIDEIDVEIENRFVDFYPNVENIQDIVEKHLMRMELYDVAKNYILYRAEREKTRKEEQKKNYKKF